MKSVNKNDLEKFLNVEVFSKIYSDYLKILEDKRISDPEIFNELKYLKYSIFYSNPLHTLKEGKIYFIGLNPGGCYNEDENRKRLYEYDNNLNIYKNLKENYCSYLDEFWEDEKNEKYSILQVKAKKVLDYIISIMEYPFTVREVFSTNINFIRSNGEKDLLRYGIKFDYFWNYHKEFLKIVKPDLIICNGYGESNSYTKSSFSILKEKLNVLDSDINKGLKSDNNLKYFKKQIDFINPIKETLIIGVSHLSYYNPDDMFYKSLKNVLLNNT